MSRQPLESTQYVSIRYTERLAEAGVEPSVGSVGDSYDNALAETINGLYKGGAHSSTRAWRNFEAVEFATLEWVDWFNHRRLLEPIGNIPAGERAIGALAAFGSMEKVVVGRTFGRGPKPVKPS
jgi:transposase InsO family protein